MREKRGWLAGVLGAVLALVAVPLLGTAPAQASPAAKVAGTPCGAGVAACVALGKDGYNGTAWLIRGGKVARGPVAALTGGPGEDTPVGTFHVLSKDLHHVSTETHSASGAPSPMPYSVFFTSSGVAFHGGGDMNLRTAGCVRLADDDARYFFDNLNIGDTVQVVDGGGDYTPEKNHDDGGGGGGGLLGL